MTDHHPDVMQSVGLTPAPVAASGDGRPEEPGVESQPAAAGCHAEKPKPIISGQSQAEGLAKFASRMAFEDLAPERRERLKVSILDSLASAVSALDAPPVAACLAQAKAFGGPDGDCTLIGGGAANVVYAAFYNTALVRYVDFMDSYLSGTQLCHPSDNTASVLAACEHAGQSGKEFLTALAVAYQVESTLTVAAPFMDRGFDLTTPLTYSLGAGVAKALGLDEAKTAAAVEICGQTGLPLLVARTTPISQWKGLSSAQVALGCVNAVFLASRGVTGPVYVIEGSCGLSQALDQPVDIDWEHMGLDCFDRLTLKSYNSAAPTESAIFCMLELHKLHPFDPAEIASVEADVVQTTFDFTGGGRFGPKTNVHTKEDADHSLPYLLAVALLDGDVQTAQLSPERIAKADVQSLLHKVSVRPDASFTARYPDEFPSRMTVRLENGQSFAHEVSDYPGFPTRPFTWQEIGAKFDRLAGGRIGPDLRQDIKNAVWSLEDIQVSDLTKLLGELN
jgi:2-methylcitrate dehydratase